VPDTPNTFLPRRAGEPVDRLLATYAIVAGTALLFAHRPDRWWLIALAHIVAIPVGFGTRPFRDLWNAMVARWPRSVSAAGDLYPLVLVPALYAELPALNLSVWDGRYFDPWIIRAEELIFGLQPSAEMARALPILPLSELLHSAYLSYYLIIFVPPLLIWWRAGRTALSQAVFALMLTFVAHYIFFIFLPVQGPRYLFPAPGGALADGPVYQLAHRILEAGSSRGAAFPSSHVGVAVAQTVTAWRWLRPLAWPVGVLAIGLALGAIYGGFHYATDAIAGAALGATLAGLAPRVYERIRGNT
jgi:membrane-associated phospholipid phosphatase